MTLNGLYILLMAVTGIIWFFCGWMYGEQRTIRRMTKDVRELHKKINEMIKS